MSLERFAGRWTLPQYQRPPGNSLSTFAHGTSYRKRPVMRGYPRKIKSPIRIELNHLQGNDVPLLTSRGKVESHTRKIIAFRRIPHSHCTISCTIRDKQAQTAPFVHYSGLPKLLTTKAGNPHGCF
jgi:hypothetical protein